MQSRAILKHSLYWQNNFVVAQRLILTTNKHFFGTVVPQPPGMQRPSFDLLARTRGKGTVADHEVALTWHLAAAEQNHRGASSPRVVLSNQYRYATRHGSGADVVLRCLGRWQCGGAVQSRRYLCARHRCVVDFNAAVRHWEESAQQGRARVQMSLALAYTN